MTTKRRLLFLISSVLLGLTLFLIWQVYYLPNPASRLEAEKEIYALLLADRLADDTELLPIAEFTTLGQYDQTISGESIESYVSSSSEVKQATINDFEENNKQSYLIKDYLPTSISNKSIKPQDWRISFSRIGFDSALTQALVVKEIYTHCNDNGECLYGMGGLVFLQKIDGKWVEQGAFWQWIEEET